MEVGVVMDEFLKHLLHSCCVCFLIGLLIGFMLSCAGC